MLASVVVTSARTRLRRSAGSASRSSRARRSSVDTARNDSGTFNNAVLNGWVTDSSGSSVIARMALC